MHYCFNEFFYLHIASNYRTNGLTSAPSSFVKFWVGPNWHETTILPFNPLLFYSPYLAVSLLSDGGKFLYLSLFVTAVGFHRLLLILRASIGWFHGIALGLYCLYGWALKLMSWGLLWTHLELILDGYFKCVGCTCGLWAWMARDLIIMGFRQIVWVSSVI